MTGVDTAQPVILPTMTGAQIAAVIHIDCARAGWSVADFERLCGRRTGFYAAVRVAKRPKPATIATVVDGLCRMNGGAPRPASGAAGNPFSGGLLVDKAAADIKAARIASAEITIARAARAAAVASAERAHRQRGQMLLRAQPASAFIAKARAQMEASQ